MKTDDDAQAFVARWLGVTASELATAQSFVMDLCDLLEVSKPHATAAHHVYPRRRQHQPRAS